MVASARRRDPTATRPSAPRRIRLSASRRSGLFAERRASSLAANSALCESDALASATRTATRALAVVPSRARRRVRASTTAFTRACALVASARGGGGAAGFAGEFCHQNLDGPLEARASASSAPAGSPVLQRAMREASSERGISLAPCASTGGAGAVPRARRGVAILGRPARRPNGILARDSRGLKSDSITTHKFASTRSSRSRAPSRISTSRRACGSPPRTPPPPRAAPRCLRARSPPGTR